MKEFSKFSRSITRVKWARISFRDSMRPILLMVLKVRPQWFCLEHNGVRRRDAEIFSFFLFLFSQYFVIGTAQTNYDRNSFDILFFCSSFVLIEISSLQLIFNCDEEKAAIVETISSACKSKLKESTTASIQSTTVK